MIQKFDGTTLPRVDAHPDGSHVPESKPTPATLADLTRYQLLILRELRQISTLLAMSQGISTVNLAPIPDIEVPPIV